MKRGIVSGDGWNTASLGEVTEMNAYLAPAWPLIEQAAEVRRTVSVRKTEQISDEVVSLITPLTPQEASPARLLELVRGHWGIENSSHYVRDVTFGEDRSHLRVFSGAADHGGFPQSGHHSYSSSGLFSDCRNPSPFRFSPSSGLSPPPAKEVCPAIIHKPWG
jgi:hypothetical protein